jgi:hypothetical protein
MRSATVSRQWCCLAEEGFVMPEFPIEVAPRYFKRQFQKAVGKSVLKVLTEPITNGDDSYRRIPGSGVGSIRVEFDRRKRAFAVVDQAQGLNGDDMGDAFVTYGSESHDRAAGVRTRSLFGKGLRDVLFTQEDGTVRSIKDDVSFVCKFRWRDKAGNDRPTIDIQPGPRVTPELRAAWGIAANGTRVQFRLQPDVHVPQYDRLARDLENFYMLRVITGRVDRVVSLRTRSANGSWDDRPLKYSPPAPSATTELGTREWSFDFEGHRIELSAVLNAYESAMVQAEQSYEDREGGLLVLDEDDDVLDLTLFGYDDDPAAARLFGQLRLNGAGELIRARLNSQTPEEILTETREGFDRKHAFYKVLRSQLDPWLKPFVDAERQRLGSKASALSAETRRRHQRAFDRLNKLAQQLLGQTKGPGPGPAPTPPHTDAAMEFRQKGTTIRVGSSRTVQLLVNTTLIRAGSEIRVLADDAHVVYPTDPMLEVPEPQDTEPTVALSVRLEGLGRGDSTVKAMADSVTVSMDCSVVEEDVPDLSSGVLFSPDSLDLRDGERSHLVLYADLRVVGQADEPTLLSTNPKIEVLTGQLRWEPVTKFIVKTTVVVMGRGKGEEALISARVADAEATAYVKVISKRQERDRREGGMFKDYKFATLDRKIQANLDTEGYVVINLADPANRFHFGRDINSATRFVEERPSSQTLLADLILDECLQRAVAAAYNGGHLRIRFPEDPVTDIRNYVAEHRFELGGEIHRLFVRVEDQDS